MSQMVELGLSNYSQFMQRAELYNVTQVPTNSGNASVQLATFPQVRQGDEQWLGDNEEFLDVQKCFDWIIYKVKIPNANSLPGVPQYQNQIRARKLTGSGYIQFPAYNDPDNRIYPFQTLEFTDKDGLRWVIILCNGIDGLKCWKFRSESNFNPNESPYTLSESDLGDLSLEEQTEVDKLWEIFVNGFFYDYYKVFKDWDYASSFTFPRNNPKGSYENLETLMRFIRESVTDIEDDLKEITVMNDNLRNCFKVDTRYNVSTDRTRPRDTPASEAYCAGLAECGYLIRTLDDDDNDTDDDLFSSGEIATLISGGALAVVTGGLMYAGVVNAWNPVGWVLIAAGAIAGILSVVNEWFGDSSVPRWRFSNNGDNEAGTMDWINSSNSDLSASIYANCRIIESMTGNCTPHTGKRAGYYLSNGNWFLKPKIIPGFSNGDPIVGVEFENDHDPSALLQLKMIINASTSLINNAESMRVGSEFLTARLGSLFNDDRWRSQGNFYDAWINSGSASMVSKINNYTSFDFSRTTVSFPLETSLKTIRDTLLENLNLNYDQESSRTIQNLATTIKTSVNNFLTYTRSPKWFYDSLIELEEQIRRDTSFRNAEKMLTIIRYLKNDVRGIAKVNEEFSDGVLEQIITACDKIIDSENTYLLKTEVNTFLNEVRAFSASKDDYSFTLETIEVGLTDNDSVELYISTQTQADGAGRRRSDVGNFLLYWLPLKQNLEILRAELLSHKNDFEIYDIETLSHMLVVIAEDNKPDDGIEMEAGRFYYSDIGTTNIQGLNFYSAEYANSTPVETWRLGNRLVLFTNNTIEFWDITNDFEDPISPAYKSDVYSLTVMQNSRVKFNDTLYFIAKPVEIDTYSVYSLSKRGELKQLSYPQLDTWIDNNIKTDIQRYNPGGVNKVNLNLFLQGSLVDYEHVPIIQWHLNDNNLNLCYNTMFNTFFLSDNLSFLENDTYFQLNSNKQGTLDKFEDEDGKRIHAKITTVNSNDLLSEKKAPKKYKSIIAFHGDVELENWKNDNAWNYPIDRSDPWALPLTSAGNLIPDAYQEIHHRFYRVSNMPWESLRIMILQPKQGNRNVNYKVFGIGMGVDFQSEISWNGFLRINNLFYEVE